MQDKKKPLVSVIIPLYNAEKYISETIESVINQTYENWELIVVDDCSTDNSLEIVKDFEKQDNRIRLIESESNFGGPARPRNIGIDNSKGEYIAFLDADDVWLKKKLYLQIQYMMDNDLDFTSTLSYKIDEKSMLLNHKTKNTKKEQRILNSNKIVIEKILKWNFITLSTVLIKKEKLIKFNENKNLIAVEDFGLWLMLLSKGNVKYKLLLEYLINYRLLDNSISHKDFLKQDLKTIYCILDFIIATNNYKYFTYLVQKVIIKYAKSIAKF